MVISRCGPCSPVSMRYTWSLMEELKGIFFYLLLTKIVLCGWFCLRTLYHTGKNSKANDVPSKMYPAHSPGCLCFCWIKRVSLYGNLSVINEILRVVNDGYRQFCPKRSHRCKNGFHSRGRRGHWRPSCSSDRAGNVLSCSASL